jgi:GNAT superfamily N-acetyltransferase
MGVLFVTNVDASEPIEVKVREAQLKDIKDISNLCSQFGFPADEAAITNRLSLIGKYPNQVLYAAEAKAGRVVGWVHAYEAPSLLSDATVEVGGLIVDQKYRRQGVGRALMTAVEKWTTERGFNEVLLATRIDRVDAQAFYKALGYKFVHTTHFLSKDLKEGSAKSK